MRRDPDWSSKTQLFLDGASGVVSAIPAVSGISPAIYDVIVTSDGGTAASVDFQIIGLGPGTGILTSAAVSADSSFSHNFGGAELGIASGLQVSTSGPVDITIFWVGCDETTPITKAAGRAATYLAATTGLKAIRTPNRFGGQSAT